MVILSLSKNLKTWCLYICIVLLFGCNGQQKSVPHSFSFPKTQKPEKVLNVGFLIMDGVYNTELTAPMDVFQHTIFHTQPGMQVFTVAKTLDMVKSFEGLLIQPDYAYQDDSLPHIDVLVVPSAEHHLDTDLEDVEMINFVKETGQNAQYIMSLCDGAFVLAKAGLLDGLASTTFPSDIDAYKQLFPHLEVHEEVIYVHDGKAITGAGGARSFDPAMYLVEMLYGKKVVDGIGRGLIIDWHVEDIPALIVYEDEKAD